MTNGGGRARGVALRFASVVMVGNGIDPCAAFGFITTRRGFDAVGVGELLKLADAERVEVDVVRLISRQGGGVVASRRFVAICRLFIVRAMTAPTVKAHIRSFNFEALFAVRLDDPLGVF